MNVRILGLEQAISFEDGNVTHFLLLEAGEHSVRAVITEESALILQRWAFGAEPEEASEPAYVENVSLDLTSVTPVLWEEEREEALEPAPLPPAVDATVQAAAYRKTPREQRHHVPSRTVAKDDWGYPIIHGGGVDPASVKAPGNEDEDGVGSI